MRNFILSTVTALILMMAYVAFADDPLQRHLKAKVTEVWTPVPEVVTPGDNSAPPSDAEILFDGSSLDQWRSLNGSNAGWTINDDGSVTVKPGSGDILTRENYGDVQLHVEWRTPADIKSESQGRGNSGVFLMQHYEVQVLDSFNNDTYPNGQAGSVYKQHIPLVNASRKPGAWQTYDIIFTAPRFSKNGRLNSPARVTVLHNGVLIQNNVTLAGHTAYVGAPQYNAHGELPIKLQDHSNLVSYRNIWVRRL